MAFGSDEEMWLGVCFVALDPASVEPSEILSHSDRKRIIFRCWLLFVKSYLFVLLVHCVVRRHGFHVGGKSDRHLMKAAGLGDLLKKLGLFRDQMPRELFGSNHRIATRFSATFTFTALPRSEISASPPAKVASACARRM
jgi:hypothetical protein